MAAVGPDWGLAEKAIIVTGATSGIGAQIARALGAAGASVALVGRDAARMAEVKGDVEDGGGTTLEIVADLEDPAAPASIIGAVVAGFGGIDGMVHCASLFEPLPLPDTTPESFERQLRVNVIAPFSMTQAALDHLRPDSSIVFLASTIALVGFPMCSAYTATKGATVSMARAFAIELAPLKVRVNTIAPGYVYTPMLQPSLDAFPGYHESIIEKTPIGRIAEPHEIATSVLFLLSGLSANIDGATIVSDGGWTAQ
jgi:NAD(P)-dependent dehydrogenase (short-subunit alcohol dehydrogenase family)